MSDVRTFRAGTMQEALAVVRREFGPEAVILHTREKTGSRLWPWSQRKTEVEVTAGREIPASSNATSAQVAAAAVLQSATSTIAARTRAALSPAGMSPSGLPQTVTSPVISARPSAATPVLPRPASPSPMIGSPASRLPAEPVSSARTSGGQTSAPQTSAPQTGAVQQPVAENLAGDTYQSGPTVATASTVSIPSSSSRPSSSLTPSPRPIVASTDSELSQQVQSLQAMLAQLTARLEPRQDDIPGELFTQYTRLLDAEVPEATARQLMIRLRRDFPHTNWSDPEQARLLLTGLIERDLRCQGAIRLTPGRCKVVALVGPTGVGKTTTIAKLAANFKLRAGLRVGLVTVDTYRIAAVDQLRTYAEIIDIPMKVVTGPRDLPEALADLAHLDLVLVDTAGRSPADELQLQELKNLVDAGPVDEVHLVLSLAASPRSLLHAARQFAGVRTSALILTKLDESPGLGQFLAAIPELSIPISYLTTGQNVPDDIEPANAPRLSRLVLGFEGLRV